MTLYKQLKTARVRIDKLEAEKAELNERVRTLRIELANTKGEEPAELAPIETPVCCLQQVRFYHFSSLVIEAESAN